LGWKNTVGFQIRQVHPVFVGELTGIDLRRPPGEDEVAALHAGMQRYAVLVLPNQAVTDEEQIAFSRHLGELELAVGGTLQKSEEKRLKLELADASNLDRHNKLFARNDRNRMYSLGNRLWHSDSSFRPIPAKYSLLSARTLPSAGGNTEFADMRAAYDALDADMKALINDLVCEHSLVYSRQQIGFDDLSHEERSMFTVARQPLVRKHPWSGRQSLFLSAHAGAIVGWEKPEARDLLRHLTEHATQREFVYAHAWRLNDLVIWDNRQTMHRVCRFDDTREPRDMRRTTIAGDGPETLPHHSSGRA
jgi:alpha-ketoglutarate-dependent 2,4-dichlorophenoxyacetate dioxygenase